jgi:hypothetical protein
MMANLGSGDFESLARQYWQGWGEMLRSAAPHSQPAAPGWDEAIGWWSQMARSGQPEANEAVGRFDRQARDWFGRIQRLAAEFAGQNPAASDIVESWKKMLGGGVANPFAEMFGTMGGRGQQGFEQWFEQASPLLGMLQGEGRSWLGMPAFGFGREHQERWQRIAQLQLEYQERSQAIQALMVEAGQQAFAHFEAKLDEHAEPGRQLTSARALFDLWIDAAEEAYAGIALSTRYREAFGESVNAQMRLRAALQHEVEQAANLFGMPSRTEIDSAHRKIVQLERELRRLRDVVQGSGSGGATPSGDGKAPKAASPAGKSAKAAKAARSSPARQTKAGKAAKKPAKASAGSARAGTTAKAAGPSRAKAKAGTATGKRKR